MKTAPRPLRRARVTLGAAALALWGGPAAAASWEVQSFLDAGALRDDNIQLTTAPHESTSGYVAATRVEAKRTTETSRATFNGFLAHTTYSTGDLPDKTEEGLAVNAEKATSERSKLGFDGEFRHDALFETAITRRGTGDVRDVDVALSENTQVRRNYRVLAPSWNWLLTESSSVRLAYRYTNAGFSDDAGTDLVDYKENLLSATYTRQLNPRDELNITTNSIRYRPATGNEEADTVQLLAGLGRAFSETLRGSFALGASKSTTHSPAGDDDATGLAANASLRQSSETSTLEGVISRDVTPSGIGQALRTDQLRIFWSRRLSENLEFILETQWLRTRALEGGNAGVDRRYYEISPQLRWQWLENWYVVGSFHRRQEKLDTAPDSADSNAVFLGLSYRL